MYETAWMRRLARTFVLFTNPDDRFSSVLATAHIILVRTYITKTTNECSDTSAHLYRLAGGFAAICIGNIFLDMVKDQTKVKTVMNACFIHLYPVTKRPWKLIWNITEALDSTGTFGIYECMYGWCTITLMYKGVCVMRGSRNFVRMGPALTSLCFLFLSW